MRFFISMVLFIYLFIFVVHKIKLSENLFTVKYNLKNTSFDTFIFLGNHHFNQDSISIYPKCQLVLYPRQSPPPNSGSRQSLVSGLSVYTFKIYFLEFHVNGTIQCLLFWTMTFSLIIVGNIYNPFVFFSSFFHVISRSNLFFVYTAIYSYNCLWI